MKHKTVYVPVKNGDKNPKDCKDKFLILSEGLGVGSFLGDKSGGMWEGYNLRNKGEVTDWLKPIENVNILTDSELLELKKKWCEEAWDACWGNLGSDIGYALNENMKHDKPDKETYLNNLNL